MISQEILTEQSRTFLKAHLEDNQVRLVRDLGVVLIEQGVLDAINLLPTQLERMGYDGVPIFDERGKPMALWVQANLPQLQIFQKLDLDLGAWVDEEIGALLEAL